MIIDIDDIDEMVLYEYTASNGITYEFSIDNFGSVDYTDFLSFVWEKKTKKQQFLMRSSGNSKNIEEAVHEIERRIENNVGQKK